MSRDHKPYFDSLGDKQVHVRGFKNAFFVVVANKSLLNFTDTYIQEETTVVETTLCQ